MAPPAERLPVREVELGAALGDRDHVVGFDVGRLRGGRALEAAAPAPPSVAGLDLPRPSAVLGRAGSARSTRSERHRRHLHRYGDGGLDRPWNHEGRRAVKSRRPVAEL
ncbi:hypothetical protein Rrhod_1347 [Rhodococcus rhodnii LMG 5362]|uniref:Uncharacterized protein n=1 Tax=Rhodococcus rhodnii LMG 5362 TaxID=1273125 RepID=R7WPT0_9NOCA|nr:hypothetical protein Rrhod_1347 [Rhodococcus rhodnii LMG 5362]